jgi:hypothetical protein
MNLQANVKAWRGNIIAQDQEIQNCAFCQQSDFDAVFRL